MNYPPPSARAEAVARRTYHRPLDAGGTKFESWDQVIERAQVYHQRQLWADAGGTVDESELDELRELGLSRAGLVSGRTLWLGGTDYAYSRAASQFNCSALRLETVYDMVDAFWLLLNGCGVGGKPKGGTLHGYSKRIPTLRVIPSDRDKDWKGPDRNEETLPSPDNAYTWTIRVGDSARCWALAAGKMLASPRGRCDTVVLDFSNLRGKGGRLKGYGWICNGYDPLADALKAVHEILNRNANNLLEEQDIGDVFNWFGTVLSSRRAAECLVLDSHHPGAAEFARRKHEYWNGNPQRRQSNNSLLFWSRPSKSDLTDLLTMNLRGGEPGIVNALAAQLKCPWFELFNPCLTGDTLVAVADGRNAVPIAQLAEESGGVNRFPVYSARPTRGGRHGGSWKVEITSAVAIMTGVKPVGRLTFSNGDSIRCTPDHRIALANGTYLPAAQCVGKTVQDFFTRKHRGNRRLINSESNGYAKQHRMMWEVTNGPKPEGYEIDHIDNHGGDFLDNLRLLTAEEHRQKSAAEKCEENNPMHRIVDREAYRRTKSVQTFGSGNGRWSGLTDEYLIELATVLYRDGIPITINNLRALDPKVPKSFSKNRFGGDVKNLRAIVSGEVEYVPPTAPTPEPTNAEPEPWRAPLTATAWEPLQDEPVYDLIVEKNRNFYVITSGDPTTNYLDSEGVLVHNCFEIMLAGFCNLVSVSLPSFGRDFPALERALWLMGRANYRQTCVNLKDGVLQPWWHQTNEARRLCGVSITGVEQATWVTDYHVRRMRNSAVCGAYSMADDLGLPRPKAVTTIKPEGTRSKITNWGPNNRYETTEGVHRPLGRYVFNWINFSDRDPMVPALEAAGYKTLPNPDDPNNVLVRFPVEFAGVPFVTDGRGAEVNRESAVDQLRRYRRWNNLWADHNVSSTISFDGSEIPAVVDWIHRNWDKGYVATAFLPRVDPSLTPEQVGYPYLPQEVVTAAAFAEATKSLRPVDFDAAHTGLFELDEAGCAGGVCPVK